MKRRDLLILAGTAVAARLASGQTVPCPPPTLNTDGDSVASPCTTSTGGGTLAAAAASMAPGSWLQMTGASLPSGLNLFTSSGGLFSGGASGLSIAYCDKFARDPNGKKFYFVGSDHFGIPNPSGAHTIALQYTDATNSWSFIGNVPWGVSPGGNATPSHGYEGTTFDSTNNRLWHNPPYGTVVRDWNGGTSWGSVSMSSLLSYTGSTGNAEFFPERNQVLVAQVESGTSAGLVGISANRTVSQLVNQSSNTLSGFGGYSCFNRYSAARKLVYFGGGQGSNRVWTVASDGTVTRRDDCPVSPGPSGSGSSHTFVNPGNGNLIVYSSGSSWRELNPSASAGSQWATKSGAVSVLASNTADGSAYGCMACPTEYGVVAFVKNYSSGAAAEMWLWKP